MLLKLGHRVCSSHVHLTLEKCRNYWSGLRNLVNCTLFFFGECIYCTRNTKDETMHLIRRWRLTRPVVILLEKSNLLIFGQRIACHIKTQRVWFLLFWSSPQARDSCVCTTPPATAPVPLLSSLERPGTAGSQAPRQYLKPPSWPFFFLILPLQNQNIYCNSETLRINGINS